MERNAILRKLDRLERRIKALESENEALRNENAQLKNENAQLKKENAELKETIKRYADAKAAKKPKFPLNYSSERNEPPDDSGNKKRTKKNKNDKKRKKPGRKPKDTKPEQADFIEKIFPEGVVRSRCVLRREQFVWRLVGHEAKYVHYQIFAPPDATEEPDIPGVRNPKCCYGIEFILMLAHHVYWLGLSMDKARELVRFYTDVDIPKSQVDSLLYQLSRDWNRQAKLGST